MTKNLEKRLNLGKLSPSELEGPPLERDALVSKCTADLTRPPPCTPERFNEIVDGLSFQDKDDRSLIQELHSAFFETHFRACESLEYERMDWGDEDIEDFVEALGTGCFSHVASINIRGNRITDVGMSTLAGAVSSGFIPPACKTILLQGNPGDADIVKRALASRDWHPKASPGRKGVTTPKRKRERRLSQGFVPQGDGALTQSTEDSVQDPVPQQRVRRGSIASEQSMRLLARISPASMHAKIKEPTPTAAECQENDLLQKPPSRGLFSTGGGYSIGANKYAGSFSVRQ